MNVRVARLNDVPTLLAIKEELRFVGSSRGGFLLGSDEIGYQRHVREGQVWVLETHTSVVGFAITLGAAAFVKTPLWELRHKVSWTESPHAFASIGVGYFDQLAVRRGTSSRAAALLAFVALWNALATDRYVVTTTVVAPVQNAAAVPLIELVGGCRAGELDEVYDGFGHLRSAVWVIDANDAKHRVVDAFGSPKPSVLSTVAKTAAKSGLIQLGNQRV